MICPDLYEDILQKHPWYCFICDPGVIPDDSVIKIRDNWRNRLISIYRLNCDDRAPSSLERIDPNRKIRVLSLFDGIGTGMHANCIINIPRDALSRKFPLKVVARGKFMLRSKFVSRYTPGMIRRKTSCAA